MKMNPRVLFMNSCTHRHRVIAMGIGMEMGMEMGIGTEMGIIGSMTKYYNLI